MRWATRYLTSRSLRISSVIDSDETAAATGPLAKCSSAIASASRSSCACVSVEEALQVGPCARRRSRPARATSVACELVVEVRRAGARAGSSRSTRQRGEVLAQLARAQNASERGLSGSISSSSSTPAGRHVAAVAAPVGDRALGGGEHRRRARRGRRRCPRGTVVVAASRWHTCRRARGSGRRSIMCQPGSRIMLAVTPCSDRMPVSIRPADSATWWRVASCAAGPPSPGR